MGSVEEKKIEDIIDKEYREFSMYTIQNRAIPSVIDGLKPVQRKLLYVALQKARTKKLKIAELGGSISSINYHHGETSAQDAAVGMAQDWNNNAPLLTGHGNFGSRLVHESAAPRYIFATVSGNYDKWFDNERILPKAKDPEDKEPAFYAPIIPYVLVNGIKGIAVGFATTILPHAPEDVAKACMEYISGADFSELKPTFPSFKGKVESGESTGSWIASGVVENKSLDYIITELPPGYDREKYIIQLEKLMEADKIRSYEDLCDKNGFKFKVKVTRAQKQKIEVDPLKYFNLKKTFSENLTCLDENGELIIFDDVYGVIRYFCDFMIGFMQKRIDHDMDELDEKISFNDAKIQFISDIVNGVIVLDNYTKKQLLKECVDRCGREDWAERLINIPIYNCTSDMIEKLRNENNKLTKELNALTKETPKKLYAKLLKNAS